MLAALELATQYNLRLIDLALCQQTRGLYTNRLKRGLTFALALQWLCLQLVLGFGTT
jgi:hypothetical protein